MALKDNLLLFFKKNVGNENISYADISTIFNEITNYSFETPTQFYYFRSALINGRFLQKNGKKVFAFDWEKIRKTFPEVKK